MIEDRYLRVKKVFTFANGAAGADLIQTFDLPCEGELLWIHQRNANHTNPVTAQLTLEDQDGYQFWDGTAKNENANYDFEFGVTIRRIFTGKATLKCTISGNPGATGAVITAVINFIGRQG